MSKQFDPQQQAVLDSVAKHQLVSASAGSGKTTVMIQKITDLLLNGKITTDELLVVTFTNLASIEMKERLISNITQAFKNTTDETQKNNIQNILDTLQTASIDTIDGFCSKMLKKYFYQANLNPDIKIISSFSQEYYINKALDITIKSFGETNEKDLILLCDIFEKKSRSLDTLKENLLKAFNYCICQTDYNKFLDNVVTQYNDLLSPSCSYLNNYICNNIHQNLNNLVKLLPLFTDYPKLHTMVNNFCKHLLQLNETNGLILNAKTLKLCPVCNFSNTERISKDNFDYEKLKFYVDNLKTIITDTNFLNDIEDESYLKTLIQHLESFITLLKLFINNYTKLKQDNDVMDFNDLERKMLDLLKTESISKDFHDSYKYVFVDEYQDINPMQDQLINLILSNSSNLFLVGDVKQSIYGFRQSTPELFIQAYKNYKHSNADETAFDMNINFRSSPQILKFNNEIFCHLMTEKDCDIDYKGTSQFEPKRDDFPTTEAVEILVASTDNQSTPEYASGLYSVKNHVNPPKSVSANEVEINAVVNKIKNLIGSTFYDSNIKDYRELQYSDIAILSRSVSNDNVQSLADALVKNNIPINISRRTDLKESECVNKILSLLKILNYTASDIDYTFLFTSPLVNVSYSDLLSVYADHSLPLYNNLKSYSNNSDELAIKIRYGFNLCDEWRIASSTLNIVELIYLILDKYHLRQHLITSVNGRQQLSILDEFLNSLSSEEKNLSITKFIDLVEQNKNSSNEIIARDSINSVTIQTIHASKGLEYPVVILFNAGKQFKYITDYSDLNFDLDLGIGLQYYNLEKRKRHESPTRFAIKLKNKEKFYKEELRLLYVATTRAKNLLIITGCCSEDKLKSNTLPRDNYLSLILSTYYSPINTNLLANSYKLANCKITIVDDIVDINTNYSDNKKVLNADYSTVKQNIDYVYPYINETSISIKNNVTALSRIINDEYNIAPIALNLKENLQATTDDYAQIGTEYHNILSNIDFCSPYNYINDNDIIDEKLIKLAHDKLSPIAKGCIKQYNEKQFMMYVPYKDIYPNSDLDTKILVQGVIDLILEYNDHIILIDYKYSNLPINKLYDKYKTQIMLYKLALEKAFKKPVTNSYIYSIKTGEIS